MESLSARVWGSLKEARGQVRHGSRGVKERWRCQLWGHRHKATSEAREVQKGIVGNGSLGLVEKGGLPHQLTSIGSIWSEQGGHSCLESLMVHFS